MDLLSGIVHFYFYTIQTNDKKSFGKKKTFRFTIFCQNVGFSTTKFLIIFEAYPFANYLLYLYYAGDHPHIEQKARWNCQTTEQCQPRSSC